MSTGNASYGIVGLTYRDTKIIGDKSIKQLGGVFNVAKSLRDASLYSNIDLYTYGCSHTFPSMLEDSHFYDVSPKIIRTQYQVPECYIDFNNNISNLCGIKDYSNNIESFSSVNRRYDAIHIAYLNELKNLSSKGFEELRYNCSILTADLTNENAYINTKYLPFIDYLFLSSESNFCLNSLMTQGVKNIILHGRNKIEIIGDYNHVFYVPRDDPDFVDTVGAGDCFAANFIYGTIEGVTTQKTNLQNSYEATLRFLRGQNRWTKK